MIEKIIQAKSSDYRLQYFPIGESDNISETLFLMNFFLDNFKEEVKLGIEEFQNCTLSTNCFRVEYGDPGYDDDYYVSFTDEMFYKQCEDENGYIYDDSLPRLKLSYENFDHILQTWTRLQEAKPTYLITVKYEDGWVDIWGREELSEAEKKILEADKNYTQNRKLLAEGKL